MRTRWIWLVAVAAAACNEHGKGGGLSDDVPPFDAMRPPSCDSLDRQIAAAAAMPGTCFADSDCTTIGGQHDLQTCDCAPFTLSCGGQPIESNAPGIALANSLIAQWWASHCDIGTPQVCDCGLAQNLRCGSNHRCTGDLGFCNLPPPDAPFEPTADAL